jgi:hypothetical protein
MRGKNNGFAGNSGFKRMINQLPHGSNNAYFGVVDDAPAKILKKPDESLR